LLDVWVKLGVKGLVQLTVTVLEQITSEAVPASWIPMVITPPEYSVPELMVIDQGAVLLVEEAEKV
jgi:hypothetical protein